MRKVTWLMGASVGVLSSIGVAAAQDSSDAEVAPRQLDTVIVTAQKVEESAQDVPISIDVIDSNTLEKTRVTTLRDLLELSSGLSISTTGNGFATFTYIRGAGSSVFSDDSDPSVAYFVDEVYVAGQSGLQPDLLDVERIEVLKGPQGTLFGRNASAGAISIIQKRPSETFEAWAAADIGSSELFAARGGFSGPLTSDGAWRYRVAGSHRQRNGFADTPFDRDPGAIETFAGRAALEYDGENLNALFTGDFFTSDNAQTHLFLSSLFFDPSLCSIIEVTACATLPVRGEDFFGTFTPNLEGFQTQDTYSLTSRIEWTLPFATLTSITGYRNSEFNRVQDQDTTEFDSFVFNNFVTNKSFSQELRLSSVGERFRWVAGLYYFDSNAIRNDRFDVGPVFPVPFLRGMSPDWNQDIDVTSYAVFGQATYEATDKLSLTVGGRYTRDEKTSNRRDRPFGFPVYYTLSLSPEFEAFDPMAAIDYKASENVLLYASFRQGFKSGGFQSLPSSLAVAQVVFDPEKVKSYELGIKSQWLDNRLLVNAALFSVDITNQQLLRIPDFTATLTDNAGQSESNGIDITISALVSDRLRFDWNSTFQKARFVDYVSGVDDFSGNNQLRSPDVTTSLVGEYTHPIRGAGDLVFRGEHSYRSDIFFDPLNTTRAGSFQPSYSLVNARITFVPDNGNWDFSLWGKNLTDEQYFGSIALNGLDGLGAPADPLTFGASLNWNWN